jgi:DNA invertase Pin-like site-specific DNA recombinase
MTKPAAKRCAIYTRKSSEEGLEQDFNSLHAQREACEAFIKSQQSEGWRLIPKAYDDGGVSGGTMERLALQQLLSDVGEGKVDVVVVYKVDRLTRSLADFAKMVEVFDARGVSFVAVTQQFNTTTSMGRLTLNVLLSFAQFEREVTGERIRDKLAASKRKGLWMGGFVPFGYEAKDRKLLINPAEAELVRQIFQRYDALGNVRTLQKELDERGISRPYWRGGQIRFSRSGLYNLLRSPIYVGEIPHKEVSYPGLHEAIIDRALWDSVQRKLMNQGGRARNAPGRKTEPSFLMGKLRDESGTALTPTHAVKAGRRYRYYSSPALLKGTANKQQGWRLPAHEIERTVATAVKSLLEDHKAIAKAMEDREEPIDDAQAAFHVARDWAQQITNEAGPQAVAALLDRVDLKTDGFQIVVHLPLGSSHLRLCRSVPMQMKRRGVELKMIVGGTASKADPVLLKALGRAHRWFEALKAGKLVPEIAREEGIAIGYVRRVLQLAFLAPSIVEAIVNGTQPPDLTTQKLVFRTRLDPDWDKQRKQLGFA